MHFVLDVVNYMLTAIMIGVVLAWIFLIKSMWNTFSKSPFLDKFNLVQHDFLRVSVILPARNEEKFIEKCINSLLDQDYTNYQIIAIDDRSDDKTGTIIENIAKKNSKVVHVLARPKPDKWMGKNWACIEGYKKSDGELLLFTDADTVHNSKTISLAVAHLSSEKLDALTVIPKMLCLDWWTKITLPVLSTFLHTRFSALRVNDPSKKTGYFFGSFFIIRKDVYEKVGTHEGVKTEIVEDGALGKKVKEQGFKMKMVRGEHLVEAVWARDWSTLWHALKRLMVPLYIQSQVAAIGIFVAVLFLLFMPFPLLTYSLLTETTNSASVLSAVSILAIVAYYAGSTLDAKKGLSLGLRHSAFAPIGSIVIVAGFATGILHAKKNNAVSWRGRTYCIAGNAQNSINI